MDTAIQLTMIILSVALTLVILLQSKGNSFSGAFGGDTSGINRTRRGFEKTLFQLTIVLAVLFVFMAIVASLFL